MGLLAWSEWNCEANLMEANSQKMTNCCHLATESCNITSLMDLLSNWASGHLVCHGVLNVLNYLDWYKLAFIKQSKKHSGLTLKAGRLSCSSSFYVISPILNGMHNIIFIFFAVVNCCCWTEYNANYLQHWRLLWSHSNGLTTSNPFFFFPVSLSLSCSCEYWLNPAVIISSV